MAANQSVTEVTEPTYFRVGQNSGGSDIAQGLILQHGATQEDDVAAATAATQKLCGVAAEIIEANRAKKRSYQMSGVARVLAGAAVAIDDLVTADATSRAVTAATGNVVLGRAKSAAANAGEWISVELWTPVRAVAP